MTLSFKSISADCLPHSLRLILVQARCRSLNKGHRCFKIVNHYRLKQPMAKLCVPMPLFLHDLSKAVFKGDIKIR